MLQKFKRFFRNRKLQWQLNKLGNDSVSNVLLNDGVTDIYIERLLLLDDSLLIIKFIDYEGYIYAADNIEYWTQLVGRSGYKFSNPVRDVQRQIGMIEQYFPGVQIGYYIIFSDECEFPKGRPENVLTSQELIDITLNEYKKAGDAENKIDEQWKNFVINVVSH